ncbi:sperm flagellar protein 2 isoform X2 [Megalopta genalis]|uniref:sperm flagellar protein 2 isoform X2 n=1 Tax=Megalopta genalis TaxID=115081 RepID=UPI003FD396D5
MARAYVEWLKCRKKRATTVSALNAKMQKTLLHRLWERISWDQEQTFDEAIAGRTLEQSRYEKQMMTKLCEVWDQKNVMLENQKIIEDMTEAANEVEYLASLERGKDRASKLQRDAEAECQRMCELRQRIAEEKVRKLREKHHALCRETVQEIVDLVLKIEDYRQLNNGIVPQTILREWIVKFLKGEPLGDPLSDEADEKRYSELAIEEASRAKLEQIEILREALLEDYLEMKPPWDLHTSGPGTGETDAMRLGRFVLGYIVHRLLNYVHPRSSDPAAAALPALPVKLDNVAVILGISSPTVHESLRELLDRCEIRLVRMEDAINYCLDRYKNEMLDVDRVDSKIVAATDRFVEELETSKQRISCAKFRIESRTDELHLGRRSRSTSLTRRNRRGSDELKKHEDKQTQTPRNLPYDDMDPQLTDAAYIGKWAYEFLQLGQPITNDLSTKIMIEYLRTLTDAKGWALIDYPITYEQMSLLETSLTGFKIPPDPETLEFENITVEDVQSLSPRIVYDAGIDPIDAYRQRNINPPDSRSDIAPLRSVVLIRAVRFRQSRLVPTPIKRIRDIPTPTFAKLFVRVTQKPIDFEIVERSVEAVPANAPSVDKFYASRKIGHVLYYSHLDETTLKKLARLIIGEPLQSKNSEELFGESQKGYEKGKSRSTGSKAPVVRRLIVDASEDAADSLTDYEIELDREGESGQDYEFLEPSRAAKPGEAGWDWVDLPLPSSSFVQVLASLWEGLEETYLEDLKELLFLKSVHTSGIVPYKSNLEKNLREFVKRPDNKQDLLNDFHLAFNDLDDDARHDSDVKCEMHRRLADFQAVLWETCDKRRQEAERERARFIDDEWTVEESAVLYDVYVGIVQTELDRCIDTVHTVLDYYAGMSGKPMLDPRFPKIVLNQTQMIVGLPEEQFAKPIEEKPAEKRTSKRAKVKSDSAKTSVVVPLLRSSPPVLDTKLLQEQIRKLLANKEEATRELRELEIVKAIERNVQYAKGVADEVAAMVDRAVQVQGRLRDSKNVPVPIDSGRDADLALERKYATDYEIQRLRARLDAIEAAARNEFVFLLETMRNAFHKIYDDILERYWLEMKSVNDMATVFCFAIEEGRYLEKEMLLDADRFIVRSNVLVREVPTKKPESLKETETDTRFRMAQLSRLAEVFRRVAPHGIMPERAFVLILQDLVGHGLEEGESMVLPCCWYRFRPADVCVLVRRLFGTTSHVDWREFVIYAMDLPMPSFRDILIARDRFRIQDCDLKEVVSVDQFIWTPLWFLECIDMPRRAFELLIDNFQYNHEELYEEELFRLERDKYDVHLSKVSSDDYSDTDCLLTEETLRLVLAKELLCRMYTIGRRTVNYTALLLAFCKDEDPREGFGKALALAIGTRVCTDVEQGERYVEELYQRMRYRHTATPESSSTVEQQRSGAAVNEVSERRSIDKVSTPDYPTYESFFGESDYKFRASDHESVEYWVSLDVCLTTLCATLPSFVLSPELLGKHKNLRDALTEVYGELRDDELEEQETAALVHRLLNHRFVRQLLNSTTKFTVKNMGKIVEEILRSRRNAAG